MATEPGAWRCLVVRMVRCSAPYDWDAVGLQRHGDAWVTGGGVGAGPDLR